MPDYTKKELEILVDIQKKELDELRVQLKDLPKEASASGAKAGKDFSESLAAPLKMLGASFAAFFAVDKIKGLFTEAINASLKFEKVLLGVDAAARQSGQSISDARKKTLELSKDGVLSLEAVGQTMRVLAQQGLNLDQSFELIEASKKVATFRGAMETTAESVQSFFRGTLTGSAELLENLDVGLKQTIKSLGGYEKVASDANVRQALYNKIIAEGAKLTGDYNVFLQSGTGIQQAFANKTELAAKALGDNFLPILNQVRGAGISFLEFFTKLSSTSQVLLVITPILSAIGAAIIALIIKIGSLTTAIGLLWTAISGPIGIAIAAITAITVGVVALSEAFSDNRSETEKLADSYEELANSTERNTEESEKLKKANDLLLANFKDLKTESDLLNLSLKDRVERLNAIAQSESEIGKRKVTEQDIEFQRKSIEAFKEILQKTKEDAIERFNKTWGSGPNVRAWPSGLTREDFVERTKSVSSLREELLIETNLLEILENRFAAQDELNESKKTGLGLSEKEQKLINDNLYLHDEWQKRLKQINYNYDNQVAFLTQIHSQGNAAIRQHLIEHGIIQENEKLNERTLQLLIQQEIEYAKLVQLTQQLNNRLDQFATGLEGVADTLEGSISKSIEGILKGVGKITTAIGGELGAAIGSVLGTVGTIIGLFQKIGTLIKENNQFVKEAEAREKTRVEWAERLEQTQESIFEYAKEQRDIEDDILDIKREQLYTQEKINDAFEKNTIAQLQNLKDTAQADLQSAAIEAGRPDFEPTFENLTALRGEIGTEKTKFNAYENLLSDIKFLQENAETLSLDEVIGRYSSIFIDYANVAALDQRLGSPLSNEITKISEYVGARKRSSPTAGVILQNFEFRGKFAGKKQEELLDVAGGNITDLENLLTAGLDVQKYTSLLDKKIIDDFTAKLQDLVNDTRRTQELIKTDTQKQESLVNDLKKELGFEGNVTELTNLINTLAEGPEKERYKYLLEQTNILDNFKNDYIQAQEKLNIDLRKELGFKGNLADLTNLINSLDEGPEKERYEILRQQLLYLQQLNLSNAGIYDNTGEIAANTSLETLSDRNFVDYLDINRKTFFTSLGNLSNLFKVDTSSFKLDDKTSNMLLSTMKPETKQDKTLDNTLMELTSINRNQLTELINIRNNTANNSQSLIQFANQLNTFLNRSA